MGITMKSNNDKSYLCIDGELTIYSVKQYQQSLVDKFSDEKILEVDMSAVDEIDISGLQLLAVISKQLADNGSEMKIIQASDEVTEALDTCRLMTNMKCDSDGEKYES